MPEKKIKRTITQSKAEVKDTELVKIITNDKQLAEDKSKVQLFLSLARCFDEDLKTNLFLSSLDLDEKYATYNVSAWVDFKEYSPVRNYIDKFIRDIQFTEASKTISRDGIARTADAINVQDIIEGKRAANKNNDVIVFLIPQRNYKKVV